ncbi:ribosome biogenesis GTP-binding protein YihA/YsxC [Legionella londiniensis]|uniref:Probable GTP-binding protein EngB n=1 Tax=Legionella londiniensis TaxID=45068 RepID=A0A0W0VJ72_9GAMM|nr:ribosome biogenesis GTP-binding protein YihA/YsxC [Legionella londiniensis]KTD20165.1 GTP-binding protein [Legionella londiniensis]STX94332.1 GTP-binding protein [Legionella londiniensis]
MIANPYAQTQFLKSVAKINQLPEDTGYEVAFAGRSNAGKSSALNCLTGIKQLARTSKTPGRTQLINIFSVKDTTRRLIDLPGYGYAKVNLEIKQRWQETLARYLETRQCLRGLILLMDIRHPLKELDQMMADWAIARHLPVHILLTKADKLSKGQVKNTVLQVQKHYEQYNDLITAQSFSALKKLGVEPLIDVLNHWLDLKTESER